MVKEIVPLPGTGLRDMAEEAMTRLAEMIDSLKIHGKVELGGRWAQLNGEHCSVYIVEDSLGISYFVWCGPPGDRTVEHYRDPHEAIRAGLERSKQSTTASQREAACT